MNGTLVYGLDEVENREEREQQQTTISNNKQQPTSVWFPSSVSEPMQVLYIISSPLIQILLQQTLYCFSILTEYSN